jgi:hypothetical protein
MRESPQQAPSAHARRMTLGLFISERRFTYLENMRHVER